MDREKVREAAEAWCDRHKLTGAVKNCHVEGRLAQFDRLRAKGTPFSRIAEIMGNLELKGN